MIAAIFCIIGACLKLLINYSLGMSLLGQFMLAIAQPFIIASPGKIASSWFRVEVVS